MGSKVLVLPLVILLLVSNTHCWQHASEADLLQAIKERTNPLLVTYVFFTTPGFDQYPTLTPPPAAFIRESQPRPSQDLEPHWMRIEDAAQEQQLGIDVMSIDCSTNLATCLDLDVKVYPTIRLYHPDGRIIRYRGPRKSAPIFSFLRRALRPVITDLHTPEEPTSFITSDDIVFLANLTPSEAPLYEEHFRHLAQRYHDRYTFGMITHQPHPDSQSQESTIRCYNNPNSETFTLTSRDLPLANSLTELLSQCTAPLIYEPTGRKELAELAMLSSQNAKSGLIVHFFTKSTTTSSSSSSSSSTIMSAAELDLVKGGYKKEILPLAKKYAGEILFTIIDGDEHPGMGPTVGGLPPDVGSGISVENVRTGELFPYLRSKISADQLEEFLGDVLRGEVKPWYGQEVLSAGAGNRGSPSPGEMGHDEL